MATTSQVVEHVTALMDWLSSLTLGQIWTAVYIPLTPFRLAVVIIALSLKAPTYFRRFSDWRQRRKVYSIRWVPPEQAEPGWKGRILDRPSLDAHMSQPDLHNVSGYVESGNQYVTCYDPSTGYHLETMPVLDEREAAERIERAHTASLQWRKTTFVQRISLMRTLKKWVMDDMDAIVRVACRDTGKTRVDAVFGEILVTLAKIDWIIKHGEKPLAPSRRAGNLLLAHKVSSVHYEPLGVTLACVSWNYSFHNLISPILASLFAGNAVVVKCSEQVAWSSESFVEGIKACLDACGMDPDVVQLIVCLPDVADTVTRNPLIKHITFIGSEPVGRKVAMAAAEIMVPTCIELGGKDPALLLPDAKLETWANHLMRGVFQSAGQNCIGIELVLVHRSSHDRLVDLLLPRIQALRLGRDVGSLISSTPIDKLERLIDTSVKQGARLLAGGRRHTHPDFPSASYFQPTLLTGVTMDMDVAKNELFAPVMSIVPYDTVDEAVEMLNRSRFGLGAGVYGENKRQCQDVASRLQCGMVAINDFGVFYLNQAAPFGGVKASGHGRFGEPGKWECREQLELTVQAGEEGLRSLCNPKTVTQDRFFSYVRTSIPSVVAFPLPAPETSWAFLHGLVHLAHGGLWTQIKGLGELISASLRA